MNYRKVTLPEGQQGTAKILKCTVSPEQAMWANLRNLRDDKSFMDIRPGDYTRLIIDGTLYMSDTDMEFNTNSKFMEEAKGDVLIAGLGIGLVLENLREKLESGVITRIHIIEKFQDVIDLVAPHYKDLPNVTIECADIFERQIPRGEKWDTLFFDIWPSICGDNYPEMQQLKAKYKKTRKRGAKTFCWVENVCRRMWKEDQVYDNYCY